MERATPAMTASSAWKSSSYWRFDESRGGCKDDYEIGTDASGRRAGSEIAGGRGLSSGRLWTDSHQAKGCRYPSNNNELHYKTTGSYSLYDEYMAKEWV
jgi:hypothetical protein